MAARFDTVSTTGLIRRAGERSGWKVVEAIGLLRSWSFDHPNAGRAVAVIVKRAKGAPRFAIERSGFVVGVSS